MLGTIATTVAIIAVSWVGLLMLLGRFEIRRGLTVVAGCFVLFSASAIAGGIRASLGSEMAMAFVPPEVAPPPYVPLPRRNPDPYAGASVPGR
jgi:hypothetical protein